MKHELLVVIVAALTSGGFLGAIVSIYTARKKVPVERDSIIVSGAETAVLSIERTLAAETKRADRAEAALAQRDELLARKDARIESLERKLDLLQQALDAARKELRDILAQDH